MGLTNFPNGISSFGSPIMPMGVPFGYKSKSFFVLPAAAASTPRGSDGNKGTNIRHPLATLSQAQTLATADMNDSVFMIAQSNSASSTTDYQSAALSWAKDGVHLIGVNCGNRIAARSRVAQLSTATGITGLLTVSADNCLVQNIHVFQGVNDATSLGAVLVSGDRNHFVNCHFAGIGHATQDAANNYSLKVTGSENLFERCTIGLDTIARGTAANWELELSSGATRNKFVDCDIITYAEAATHQFLYVPVNGIDRWTQFVNCRFINMPTGDASGTTMTEAFDVTGGGSPDGIIILDGCTLVGATDWEAAAVSGKVMIRTDGGTAATAGLSADVAAS
jgi:hypothetical protein